MFTHQQRPFGPYQLEVLRDASEDNQLTLCPQVGASVLGLQLQGQSVLDVYTSPTELEVNRWAKNMLLYPFPNRLRNGQYEWDGKTYQFPITDSLTDNALHGFGMERPMQVESVQLEELEAAITCVTSYEGEHEFYPFPFRLSLKFKLGPGSFAVKYQVENTGATTMPFGFGWHPYFQLDDKIDDCHLQIPTLEMIGIDQRMLPTGKTYTYDTFARDRTLGSEVLDNTFRTPDHSNSLEIHFSGKKGAMTFWQESGPRQFPFVQLFTHPEDRASLAIEPMTCNVDAFNNGEGLLRLEPGEKADARFGLRFRSAKA